MTQPILTLAVDDGQLTVHRSDGRLDVNLALAALAARGYDGACLALGNAVLCQLSLDPELLAPYPALAPPPAPQLDTHGLIHELMLRARSARSPDYVPAIDALMTQLVSEGKATPGRQRAWAMQRAMLLGS